ncbi:MAG: CoA ester lyase [Ectothiorhodospiraceae bacterium]|nr:CoA ester lyase [Chromatiales bacterium]MCP5154439.1 CoA ester lyase [Ectothiorhodospiraceae bacterium]
MSVNRSFLFAPGNHARRVEKALGLDADAVILDLEDAVAVAEKPATRGLVAAALSRPRRGAAYVRVNAIDTPFCYGDMLAVVVPGLDGVVLPKVESAAALVTADWLLAQLERERGLAPGAVDLMPIVETGKGLDAVEAIARAGTRVRRLAFGAGDFTLDMGMRWTHGESELDYARARIATTSRAAGLEPPVDTVFVHLGELDALRASTERARDLGYQGKLCIHPEQVGPVNAVFSPTPEQVARARRYVAAFEAAEAAGSASIQVDGFFIDYPIVEQARRLLAAADAIATRESAR